MHRIRHWVVRHWHHWVLVWIELLWWYITVTLFVTVVIQVIWVVGITVGWAVWVVSDHVIVVHPVSVALVVWWMVVISVVVVLLVVRVVWIKLTLHVVVVLRLMRILLVRVLRRKHLLLLLLWVRMGLLLWIQRLLLLLRWQLLLLLKMLFLNIGDTCVWERVWCCRSLFRRCRL